MFLHAARLDRPLATTNEYRVRKHVLGRVADRGLRRRWTGGVCVAVCVPRLVSIAWPRNDASESRPEVVTGGLNFVQLRLALNYANPRVKVE